MEFKKFINTAIKATQYTKKGISVVRKLPLEKIAIGTASLVMPGGMVISGVYVATQELKKRYRDYVVERKEKDEKVNSFKSWLNDNYVAFLNEKKTEVVYSVSETMTDTVSYIGKGASEVGKSLKRITVGKISSIIKRKI